MTDKEMSTEPNVGNETVQLPPIGGAAAFEKRDGKVNPKVTPKVESKSELNNSSKLESAKGEAVSPSLPPVPKPPATYIPEAQTAPTPKTGDGVPVKVPVKRPSHAQRHATSQGLQRLQRLPKPITRVLKPPKLRVNTVLCALLGALLLVLSGFTLLGFPNLYYWLSVNLTPAPAWSEWAAFFGLTNSVQYLLSPGQIIGYTVQVPMAILLSLLLGPWLGLASILMYLGMGMVLPVFTNGSGDAYLSQPGLGYLLGMAIASTWLMLETKRLPRRLNPKGLLTWLKWVTLPVAIIHGCGVMTLFVQAGLVPLIQQTLGLSNGMSALQPLVPWSTVFHTVHWVTLFNLPYDLALCLTLPILVYGLRWFLTPIWYD